MANTMQLRPENRNKPILRTAIVCVVAFAVTLAILFGLMCLSSLIPRSAIEDNIYASAVYMKAEEGDFFMLEDKNRSLMVHDYADAVWLNILYSIDGEDRLLDTIAAPLYSWFTDDNTQQVDMLLERVSKDLPPNAIYDRYWHGMLLILRPLLTVTDITGVRIVLTAVLCLLLIVLCVLLWLKKQRELAIAFVLCAVLIKFPMLGRCVEYAPSWLVGLSFAIAAVFMSKASLPKLCPLFVSAGVCCAFFDFLTTETVSILLPLTVLICIRTREGNLNTFREGLKLIFLAGLLWLAGYGLTFVSKWVLSEATLGSGRIAAALGQAGYRQGADATKSLILLNQPLMALQDNLRMLFAPTSGLSSAGVFWMFIGGCGILGALVYLFRGKQLLCSGLLLLVGFIPMLRILVLNNHSIMHTFFTYRVLFITVACILTAFLLGIDLHPKAKKQKNGKGGRK